MERITMRIDGSRFLLARGVDRSAIEEKIVEAARTRADMVRVTLSGNRELDVLVTPGVPITFETEEVQDDFRDDGDLAMPFDALDVERYYDN